MCLALPVMSFHAAKVVSARIDANSAIHLQDERIQMQPPTSAPDEETLATEPPITGPKPKKHGERIIFATGTGHQDIMVAFSTVTLCKKKGEPECAAWREELNCDQIRTVAAVVQASKAVKAKWIMSKDVWEGCNHAGASLAYQVSVLRTVQTSRFHSEDARVCVDPATDDVEAWACECLDYVIDLCGGTNEECFVQQLCANGEVCRHWKDAHCQASLQQRLGVSSKSAQTNAPDRGADASLTGSLQPPLEPGALTAAAEWRTQASKRSISTDSLDSTVQGKCSQ